MSEVNKGQWPSKNLSLQGAVPSNTVNAILELIALRNLI